MKSFTPISFFLFCLIYATSYTTHAQTEAPKNEDTQLASQIAEKVAELHALRQERIELQKSFGDKIEQTQERINQLQADREKITERVQHKQQKLAHEQKLLDEHSLEQETLENILSESVPRALQLALGMQQKIKKGIPSEKKARSSRIAHIIGNLSKSHDIQLQAQGLIELWNFAEEELQKARAVELSNSPYVIEDQNRQIHAYHIRFGLVNQAMLSEDGEESGLVTRKGFNFALKDSQTKQLHDILNLLQKRRIPELLFVPFSQDLLTPPGHELLPQEDTP